MIEPVAGEHFLTSFVSAAAVVLSGAAYAALFTWGKLRQRRGLLVGAYACYALLTTAVWWLADTAHLHGPWHIVTGLMLLGYLLAPHGIWHLCAVTHDNDQIR